MNIYPEIKKIAALNEKITQLIRKLQIKIDADGLDLGAAYFVKDCEERDNHLYDANGNQLDNDSYGPVDDDYYCCQHTGYSEDDFYGTLYYKTDVDGLFVGVPFQM